MAGWWSSLLARFANSVSRWTLPPSPDRGLSLFSPELAGKLSPGQLWRTQPHLRTVVAFRARNVAQLQLHVFRRATDGSRERDRASVLARTLQWVDGEMDQYGLLFSLVGDLDLYDTAYWVVAPRVESPTGWTIRRLPPNWVQPIRVNAWEIGSYIVTPPNGRQTEVPAKYVLRFPGFDPSSVLGCSPAIDALRETLKEQLEAAKFRQQLWTRGGRVSSVLERPLDAPEWSPEAREAFRDDWYAKYTGNGGYAGGTPILEDGMTLKRIDFTAQEQQWVEAAKLSLQTVASAYHVEPAMVGMGDAATFSNMKAFRKMLYTETLGPMLAQIRTRLNSFLVGMFGLDPEVSYVEFNVMEKLQGDFEEQAAVLSTSTGRPWMTANEARARQNLPALPGGDELVVPLNVLVGGQASPRDSGSQNEVADPEQEQAPKAVGVLTKSRPTEPEVDKHTEVLVAFFRRQGKVVQSRLGAGETWWDKDRWDRELTDDLLALANHTSTEAAKRALEAHGLDPDVYDVDRTLAFLREASRRNAERINEATERQISDAIDEADDDTGPVDAAGHVFEVAESSRAVAAAATLAGFAAGFGTLESARQTGGATKTWVTGPNPRPEHARINGETVKLDEDFSNGLAWPGAASDDADQVAGCNCSMTINY